MSVKYRQYVAMWSLDRACCRYQSLCTSPANFLTHPTRVSIYVQFLKWLTLCLHCILSSLYLNTRYNRCGCDLQRHVCQTFPDFTIALKSSSDHSTLKTTEHSLCSHCSPRVVECSGGEGYSQTAELHNPPSGRSVEKVGCPLGVS